MSSVVTATVVLEFNNYDRPADDKLVKQRMEDFSNAMRQLNDGADPTISEILSFRSSVECQGCGAMVDEDDVKKYNQDQYCTECYDINTAKE